MRRELFGKIGMAALALLLALNLLATFSTRAAGKAPADSKMLYSVVRVDPATNQDNLFREAGDKGWELAGSIQIGGTTAYLVFKAHVPRP
jgi:hypothetical protein